MKAVSSTGSREIRRILRKPFDGEEISSEEGLKLLRSQGLEEEMLFKTADRLRRREVGKEVTYVVNRNINFTNICKNSCKFCAFRTESNSSESFLLKPGQVAKKTKSALEEGATEVCLQGGLNPQLEFQDYIEYIKAIRKISQNIHIHAFSPAEIDHMVKNSEFGLRRVLKKLKEAGLDSVPGTAAEVLVSRVRKEICPEKITAQRWEEIVKNCHDLDILTTSTLMYGHIESEREIIDHLSKIRQIQKETKGFTELIPLPFASENTRLKEENEILNPSLRSHKKIHAVCRVFLSGEIENIQTSWVKLGPEKAAKMLSVGANDFSGTLMEEKITRAAGGDYQSVSPEFIEKLIESQDRKPKQRTTLYDIV